MSIGLGAFALTNNIFHNSENPSSLIRRGVFLKIILDPNTKLSYSNSVMKIDYTHLLNDHTLCFEIDTSGTASEDELGDLVRSQGYSSLTSCLNDLNLWDKTVAQVVKIILT